MELELTVEEAEILSAIVRSAHANVCPDTPPQTDSGTSAGPIAGRGRRKNNETKDAKKLAVEVGFEPTVPLRAHTLSRRAP